MVLEILVKEKDKSKIDNKNKGIIKIDTIESHKLNNVNYYLYLYSIKSNNEASAKAISALKSDLKNGTQITIIKDESSCYFTKNLYPLVNDFEYKLRYFIYIKNILPENEIIDNELTKLEEKTLGELMELLFFDSNLYCQVEKLLKKRCSKERLLSKIGDIEENILWDKLDVNNELCVIKENYGEIEKNRNHVMHMHLISYEEYLSAMLLFTKINESLEKAITNAKGLPLTKEQSIAFMDQFRITDILLGKLDYIRDLPLPIKAIDAFHDKLAYVYELSNGNEAVNRAYEIAKQIANQDIEDYYKASDIVNQIAPQNIENLIKANEEVQKLHETIEGIIKNIMMDNQ